jgi:poly(3-hydroxybutyrate) depolymerase
VPLDASGAGELVVSLPQLGGADLSKLEDGNWSFEINVAGRAARAGFFPRKAVREAVARADKALAQIGDGAFLKPWSLDSATFLRDRLVRFVSHGDPDVEVLASDAKELDEVAQALEQRRDPYAGRAGAMRRAYRSPADNEMSEFGFYAPVVQPDKKYPLIVTLHGMNGRPLSILQKFFGWDEGKDAEYENRHIGKLRNLDAYVVSPDAHGNAMYRDLGEDDVMRVVEWAVANLPIDRQKVTITGPSMGGIGAAGIPLRFPGTFVASAPLCGYHSYFVRRDTAGRPVRPWERLIAEERSNVSWAYNGMKLPMWIVHGTKDLPETNSGVLIDRYKALGYPLKHDHPELGHNVWDWTYQGFKGARWLMIFKKNEHPPRVRFRTTRTRYAGNAWVHIDELAQPDGWGEVDAQAHKNKREITLTTKGIAELKLDRDPELFDAGPVAVTVDNEKLTFDGDIVLHREGSAWKAGPLTHEGIYKHGTITGPFKDIFHAPILFVYGASDPRQARANEEVARAWGKIRAGVRVKYPVMSDVEFFARGESLAHDRALFLVGNAASNRVVRELEPSFPIKVDGSSVVIGNQKITGNQLGAAFIRPNPKRPDRYVAVIEGVDALGTWRSLSLPDLLPDFVVYDQDLAPARGQVLLSAGLVRAGGFFKNDWTLPADTSDPNAAMLRPEAKNEHDATPYLP